MSPFLEQYVAVLPVLLLASTMLWTFSVKLKNVSIVDPMWSTFFVIAAWFFYANLEQHSVRGLLVCVLVTIWGVRLTAYLAWRAWGEPEDYRYQFFRKRFGAERYWWFSLFQVFWFQALLAWIILPPLLGAQLGTKELGLLDYLALGLWLIGFIFEAGSDLQLARFKGNPDNKGKLLSTGFWTYTRHPNYFGDSACWWAYGLLAISAGYPVSAIGALFMTVLIIRVSGVMLLEKGLNKNKPGYAEYVARTSAFIPMPRKSR